MAASTTIKFRLYNDIVKKKFKKRTKAVNTITL